MASDTFSSIWNEVHGHPRWTPEEDCVLRSVVDIHTVNGKFTSGSIGRIIGAAHDLLPHRSRTGILRRLRRTCKDTATKREVRTYEPLKLTEVECAWLAGLLETDGSIGQCVQRTDSRTGSSHGISVRLKLLYNVDRQLIDAAHALVPRSVVTFSTVADRLKYDNPVKPTRTIYSVELSGFRPILDFLTRVRPYLHHSERIRRADEIINTLTSRLERRNG